MPFTREIAKSVGFPARAISGFVSTHYVRGWKIISKILKQKKSSFNTMSRNLQDSRRKGSDNLSDRIASRELHYRKGQFEEGIPTVLLFYKL